MGVHKTKPRTPVFKYRAEESEQAKEIDIEWQSVIREKPQEKIAAQRKGGSFKQRV